MDGGWSVTDTPFPTLNAKAKILLDSLNEVLRETALGVHAEAAKAAA